ncbi:helix-turn-helix domain-containing protein [Amycolatopsis rhabdoformis]|uniref:Helix-turn-helix domain-containing protein n=1 Tax=Amycolatopsis rhabdoformis TaxID=1448059 RepID=A0ABZ1IK13_9PSEU|nr:helix-turn-helix domain-containing protein [Amycolatopsis rhabdoformis]WSE34088.1 helix-turn-helix domain-containing protein [Amycolatopsis rhabdoformis]
MPHYRISEAARLLGVSDDTMRRHIDAGLIEATKDRANRYVVEGEDLARFAGEQGAAVHDPTSVLRSARNRMVGLVTSITTDKVMAQVDLQCGRERVVSLMSTEAVNELGLVVGSLAVAVIKSTTVVVETPNA